MRCQPWLLALLASLFLASAPASSQAAAAKAKPFVIAMDGEPSNLLVRWGSLIYVEAFRRLGIPILIEQYTLERRAAFVDEGFADAEASRVYSYGNNRPNLVRVEESLVDLDFSLYTGNPSVRLQRLEELRTTSYQVEYRRGIMLCEKTLKQFVPAERISDVPTVQQGLRKLAAGRTDLYCDIDLHMLQELQLPEFDGAAIRKVISIDKAVPTYPYLNKKHAALAPRLAAVLKQMKAEGLIDAYRLQAERELGWKR